MRVIIADDEELIRFSVRDMLSEIPLQVTVVAEAKNGNDLVEQCMRLQPDVAIVDIRMPGMSGLDAIEALTKSCKSTDCVILTSYPEFNYARRALNAGVVQYLLKPVAPSELEAAMLQASERRLKRLQAANREFALQLGAVLSGDTGKAAAESDDGWKYTAALASIDSRGSADERRSMGASFASMLTEGLSDLVTNWTRAAVVRAGGNHVAVLASRLDALERGSERSVLGRFENRLRQVASALSGEGAACTAVIFDDTTSRGRIVEVIDGLSDLSPLRVLAGIGSVLHSRELQTTFRSDAAKDLSRHLVAAAAAAEDLRPLALEYSLREASRLLQRTSDLHTPHIERNVTTYLCAAISEAAGPLGSSDIWLSTVVDSLLDERHENGGSVGSDTIAQVKRYLEEHYGARVSLSKIAAIVGVTPNYLSTLFHQQAGVTFSKYLARLRMGKARLLLSDRHLRVGEVANAVGYSDSRHFARVFKATFGCYPSEARDRTDASNH